MVVCRWESRGGGVSFLKHKVSFSSFFFFGFFEDFANVFALWVRVCFFVGMV